MANPHVIETLEIEFGYANEAEAWARHGRMGDFAAGRALEVISEVFDEFVDAGTVLRLDRLEIELDAGSMTEAEVEVRLAEALRRALREIAPAGAARRAPEPAAGSDEVAIVSPAEADFELLWRLLDEGALPWRTVALPTGAFDDLVGRVLASHGDALAARLRAAADPSRLMARVASQWTPAHQAVFADRLGPDPAAPRRGEDVARSELAAARLGPAAWTHLFGGARETARADLRRHGQDRAWRERLAAGLTPPQWRSLLALWTSEAQAESFLDLMSPAVPETPAQTFAAGDWRTVLGEALLARLFEGPVGSPELADLFQALLAARAALLAVTPDEAARRLLAEAPRAAADRLAEALRTPGPRRTRMTGGAVETAEDRTARRMAWDAQLAQADWNDAAWPAMLASDPAWLAARLRHHGVAAQWRRGFAARLTASRMADLLTLWLTPADAGAVVDLVGTVASWTPGAAGTAADTTTKLRGGMLAALLLSDLGRMPASAVAEALVRTVACAEDVAPREVARRVAAAWPDPAAPAAILLRTLAGRATPRDAATDELADGAGPRDDHPAGDDLPAGAWTGEWLERLPRPLPAALARRIAAALSPVETGLARIAALDEPERRDLLLRLEPGRAPAALRVADRLAKAWRDADRPDPVGGMATFLWRMLLQEVVANGGDGAAWRIEARWTPALTAEAGAPETVIDSRWLARLPPRLTAARRRSVIDALTPPSIGAVRMTSLSEPERRDLLVRLAPRDGPAALALSDRLSRAWRAAGRPEPAEGVAAFDLRFLLQELLLADRRFAAPDFAARWTAARKTASVAAEGPFTDAELARLPRPLPPATVTAMTARLVPAGAGVLQLQGLTEAGRRDLLIRLAPHDGPPALQAIDRLSAAWAEAGLDTAPIDWVFLLRDLVEQERPFDMAGFTARWVESRLRDAPPAAGAARARFAETLAAQGSPALARAAEALATRRREAARAEPSSAPSSPGAVADETLYVANAGLVLLGPYIPILFARLGLVEDRAFVDAAAAERGVHLLQLAADGGRPALEHQLVLNKILCGFDLGEPVARDVSPTREEMETVEGMLATIIQRWSILGGTSIRGLRETFLRRDGALDREEEAWRLRVDPRPFDMLIDQIPWGFRTLKLPWMKGVLHVDWR